MGGYGAYQLALEVALSEVGATQALRLLGLAARAAKVKPLTCGCPDLIPPGTPEPPVTVFRVEGSPNTRLVIGDDGSVGILGDTMLFLNFGSRERAEQYLAQKIAGGLPGVQVKSFQVPRSFLDDLRADAVPQQFGGQFPNAPQIVDPTKAADQFGLTAAQLDALKDAIIEGSGKCE
ncbi:MAG TPA: hypothetical protein VEL07_06210, partial [Planctomycetota bacterium]|nr:hypothetical protein [Planctomycetota bacterium]